MQRFATNLIHRLQIEQSYAMLADVREEEIDLPDQERWLEALRTEQDELKRDEILLQLAEAIDRHESQWPAVGGAFQQAKVVSENEASDRPLVAAPPLLGLKPYFSRILVKFTGLAHKVILLAEGEVPRGLTRELLVEVGRELRAYFDEGFDELEETSKKRKKRRNKTPVVFELLVLGNCVKRDAVTAGLSRLRQRFSPRDKVFIAGYVLDCATRQVWSTSRLYWARRRFFKHALRWKDQTAEQIQALVNKADVNPVLLVGGALLAVCLMVLGRVAIVRFGLDEVDRIHWAVDFLSPLTAIGVCLALLRIKVHAMRQAQQTAIAYLVLYLAMLLPSQWPPSLPFVIHAAVLGFMLWSIASLVGGLTALE